MTVVRKDTSHTLIPTAEAGGLERGSFIGFNDARPSHVQGLLDRIRLNCNRIELDCNYG